MNNFKICTACSVEKSLDSYNRQSVSPDGKQPVCRECNTAYLKARADKGISAAWTKHRKFIEDKCHWANKKAIAEIRALSSQLTKETGIARQV